MDNEEQTYTEQHKILLNPPVRLGKMVFSIIDSSQSLDPKLQDVSYYSGLDEYKYSKEILCVIDLDKAVVSGGYDATSFIYKEINNSETTIIEDIGIGSAIANYNSSDVFQESIIWEDYFHTIPSDKGMNVNYNGIIASEEGKIEYIFSNINIDEHVSEKEKQKYYGLIENGNRSKTLKVNVKIYNFNGNWYTETVFYIETKIGNDTWRSNEEPDLGAQIAAYNNINIHDDATMIL